MRPDALQQALGGGDSSWFERPTRRSRTDRVDQFRDPDQGCRTADVVGQSGQAELTPNILDPAHQKPAVAHPVLDRAEGVLGGLPAVVQHSRPAGEALCHAVQHRLIRVPSNAPVAVTRALHLQSAAPASPAIGVVHQRRVALPADVQGLQSALAYTEIEVAHPPPIRRADGAEDPFFRPFFCGRYVRDLVDNEHGCARSMAVFFRSRFGLFGCCRSSERCVYSRVRVRTKLRPIDRTAMPLVTCPLHGPCSEVRKLISLPEGDRKDQDHLCIQLRFFKMQRQLDSR